jgi:hypothetical protein
MILPTNANHNYKFPFHGSLSVPHTKNYIPFSACVAHLHPTSYHKILHIFLVNRNFFYIFCLTKEKVNFFLFFFLNSNIEYYYLIIYLYTVIKIQWSINLEINKKWIDNKSNGFNFKDKEQLRRLNSWNVKEMPRRERYLYPADKEI